MDVVHEVKFDEDPRASDARGLDFPGGDLLVDGGFVSVQQLARFVDVQGSNLIHFWLFLCECSVSPLSLRCKALMGFRRLGYGPHRDLAL